MLFASLAQGLVPVAYALLTRDLIDTLVADRSSAAISSLVGLAITTAALIILPSLSHYLGAEVDRRLEVELQGDLFGAVGALPGLRFLESPPFLDRLRLAQQAALTGPSQLIGGGFGFVQGTTTLVGFVGTLLAIDPWIAALLAASAIPLVLAELRLGASRAAAQLQAAPFRRQSLAFTFTLIDANVAQEVQLFGLGGFLRKKLVRSLREATDRERRQDRHELLFRALLGGLAAVAAAASLMLIVVGALQHRFNVGDVAVVLAAMSALQLSLTSLIAQFGQMSEVLRLLDHYQTVLEATAEDATHAPSRSDIQHVPTLRKGIELRDVWFRYEESQPWALQGVSLTIPARGALALVGPNGAGKTTIAKLLCRFYDPTQGEVLWDGTDIREFPLDELRRHIGIVLQDPITYDLTAAENIGVGSLGRLADQRAIEEAAAMADIHDILQALPRGYETLLSRIFFDEHSDDPGLLLSVGQQQRLAIARALLRSEAQLLVLDEPTAALDPQAEAALHQRLRGLRHGRSSLLISHRLSTTRDADCIAVLNAGHLVESGSHHQLMAQQGLYAELFTVQAAGYAEEPAPLTAGG
jgi:ATP-binding cassette subfamily B protein